MKIAIIILGVLLFTTQISNGQTGNKKTRSFLGKENFKPVYTAYTGVKESLLDKEITLSSLMAQEGIHCECTNCDGAHAPCQVLSYTILLISKNEVLFIKVYGTPRFDLDLKDQFKKLKVGDLVVFYNITMRNPMREQKVGSFVYQIID